MCSEKCGVRIPVAPLCGCENPFQGGAILIDWSKENLENAIASSHNYMECLRKLCPSKTNWSSGHIDQLKNKINKYQIEWPHYNPKIAIGHGKTGGRNKLDRDNIFSSTRQTSKQIVKREFMKIVENKCSICSIGPEWNGKKLCLQVDHIDGNNTNNKLENLRILCPNCHSQTETFSNRKRGNLKTSCADVV